MDIEVVGCPIIREEDGLAKSSRNTYLSPEERKAALVLSQTINLAKQLIADGEKDADVLVAKMKEIGYERTLYLDVVDLNSKQKHKTMRFEKEEILGEG